MDHFIIGNRSFETGKKTYVMGILNVTPDSFSDGGRYNSPEKAVAAAKRLIEEGADVIDIGGESTRLGHTVISEDEETSRVVPVIRAIRERFDIPVSIDTYKYSVAKEAISAGADMLNSIWGFARDERLAELVAGTGVSVCIMHNREKMIEDMPGDDIFMDQVIDELGVSLRIAEKYGIKKEHIIIDPGVGVGFGKTKEQNLAVISHADRLVDTGYPVLMAASRKSIIGHVLGTEVDEREEGTIAISLYAASKGCAMVRVHDVLKNVRALRMWEALL